MKSLLAVVVLILGLLAALFAPTPMLRLLLSSLGLIEALKLAASILEPVPAARGVVGELLFWMGWPGIVPRHFLKSPAEKDVDTRKFVFAWARFLMGGLGILGLLALTRLASIPFELFSWALLAAILLCGHLGIATALPQIYRALGFSVPQTFDRPWASKGLLDFWAYRWNLPFVEASRFFLLKYFSRAPSFIRYGVGFLASGLLHEVALSGVARAGWGKPLLYFGCQLIGVLFESWFKLNRMPRGVRFLYAFAFILAPIGFLFHTEFRQAVFLPLYQFLGSHELTRAFILQICLTVAGVGTLLTIAAGIQVPARLGWNEELKRMRTFNEKIFRTYYGYIAGTIVFLGTVTLIGKHSLLQGGGLWLAVSYPTRFFFGSPAFWSISFIFLTTIGRPKKYFLSDMFV